MQVFSRFLLVWAIVDTYPAATAPSVFYSSMLIAWSVTEVIRYSYFVMNLRGEVPQFLTWLRYNTFYVLYPLGITSEAMLVWKASTVANGLVPTVLWVILALYVPGLFFLLFVEAGDGALANGIRVLYLVFAYDEAAEEGDERKAAREKTAHPVMGCEKK